MRENVDQNYSEYGCFSRSAFMCLNSQLNLLSGQLNLPGLVTGVYIWGGELENYPEFLTIFNNITRSLWTDIHCNLK